MQCFNEAQKCGKENRKNPVVLLSEINIIRAMFEGDNDNINGLIFNTGEGA